MQKGIIKTPERSELIWFFYVFLCFSIIMNILQFISAIMSTNNQMDIEMNIHIYRSYLCSGRHRLRQGNKLIILCPMNRMSLIEIHPRMNFNIPISIPL